MSAAAVPLRLCWQPAAAAVAVAPASAATAAAVAVAAAIMALARRGGRARGAAAGGDTPDVVGGCRRRLCSRPCSGHVAASVVAAAAVRSCRWGVVGDPPSRHAAAAAGAALVPSMRGLAPAGTTSVATSIAGVRRAPPSGVGFVALLRPSAHQPHPTLGGCGEGCGDCREPSVRPRVDGGKQSGEAEAPEKNTGRRSRHSRRPLG